MVGRKNTFEKKNESQPGFAGFLLITVFYLTRINSSTRSTRRASPNLITMDSIKGKAYGTSCAHVNMGWIPTGVRTAFCGAVHHHILKVCLEVWLWLLFKIFFVPKYIKMMFFYFFKIIFEISASKRSKTYKKN